MSSVTFEENPFLAAPVGRLFVTTGVPMALVMAMSGLLNIVDAAFLGRYVGPIALAAVSFSFPAVMVLIALGSLVGGGMSSLLARYLGSNDRASASAIFVSAHGLCLVVAFGLIAIFLLIGPPLLAGMAQGNGEVSDLARTYLLILVCGVPLQFLMNLHADAVRSEGRANFMAVLSVGVTLANIVLNYVLIVGLRMGVAGSAWGTVIAQAIGLVLLVDLRRRDRRLLPLAALRHWPWRGHWRSILALGLPLSLSFLGMALSSGAVIAAIHWRGGPSYAEIIAAYGIVTRVFGFAFMPLMALALATQTIVGTNVGAGLHARADAALTRALWIALIYCGVLEIALLATSADLGRAFVDDAAVVAGAGAIMRPMLMLYAFSGPILVLAMYFQAIGRPERTAILMLLKPFVLAPILIFVFASLLSPEHLWFAFPAADCVILILAASVLMRHRRAGQLLRPSHIAGSVTP
ncbi:MATE family efflux transporter [Novosphingobium aquimarinum]|uniref:MATE family efflux transporter n=1 Tax=Novosphingobium aquimarinum TaxID=2682494 RepID=UPI0012EC76B2|nr:MATE family efflux transporter [Novosphingobium aquimarinum]